jgi:hypothetical protein
MMVRRWPSAPVVGRQLARKFSTSLAGVPKIAVVGVGGAGGNAVNNMIERGDFPDHIHFVAANTDAQALESSLTPHRVRLGATLTGGLGAGARPEVGRSAAMASYAAIDEQLRGRSMCFITAGMGGGTGTGAAPVIARAAKEAGLLTVAVVSRPFGFEGTKREKLARQGSMVKRPHEAGPGFGPCASSGCLWRLCAARHSKRGRPGPVALSHCLGWPLPQPLPRASRLQSR